MSYLSYRKTGKSKSSVTKPSTYKIAISLNYVIISLLKDGTIRHGFEQVDDADFISLQLFMKYLRLLLFPFSLLYGFVVIIRNWLYDAGLFKSHRFNVPVISVGNLEVGGAGKSPMTEYLVRLLKHDHKLAVLSRGYGVKPKAS